MSPSPRHVNIVRRALVVTVSCVTWTGCLSQVPSALSMNRSVDSWGFSPRVLRRVLRSLGSHHRDNSFLPSLVCEVINLFCLYLSECVRAVRQSEVLCGCAGVYTHARMAALVPAWYRTCVLRVPGVPCPPNRKKGTRGPIDRALGHRGGTCLFFLMRKDKPDEQKKQFNSHSILMKPHAVLESKWQV